MASGDRTPKQKVKLKVTEEKLLNLMLKYNGGRPRSEEIILISSIFRFCPTKQNFLTPTLFVFADKVKKCCAVAGSLRCNQNACTSY